MLPNAPFETSQTSPLYAKEEAKPADYYPVNNNYPSLPAEEPRTNVATPLLNDFPTNNSEIGYRKNGTEKLCEMMFKVLTVTALVICVGGAVTFM